MTAIDILKRQAEFAFSEFLAPLEGVEQSQAWAVLPEGGNDYLHTGASMMNIVLHVASCKFMYGSIGFRNTEIRWSELANRIASFEPDWAKALEFLHESHAYWMASWADLSDADLVTERPRFDTMWPTWKILQTVIHHDGWHGGQLVMLRYAVLKSELPPPSEAEDIRLHCKDMKAW